MAGKLELNRMLTEGIIRDVGLDAPATKKPPTGKRWLIIGATVYHVTASDSLCMIEDEDQKGNRVALRTIIVAATATAWYPLFNTASVVTQAQISPYLIVENGDCVSFTGGVGALLKLRVIEW